MDTSMIERWLKATLYRGILRPARSLKNGSLRTSRSTRTSTALERGHQAGCTPPEPPQEGEEEPLPGAQPNRFPEIFEPEENYRETVSRPRNTGK